MRRRAASCLLAAILFAGALILCTAFLDGFLLLLGHGLALAGFLAGILAAFRDVERDAAALGDAERELARSRDRLELREAILSGLRAPATARDAISHTISQVARRFADCRVSYGTLHAGIVHIRESGQPEGMRDTGGLIVDLRGAPICLAALRREGSVAVRDAATDERLAPVREVLEEVGTRAALVVTLPGDDGPGGVVCLEAAAPRVWEDREVEALREVADDLALVLQQKKARARWAAAEEARAANARELERSNRELQQFAQIASHDLQEPLRMVAGYTQLLARRYGDRLDDEAEQFIRYAVDGVDRMQQLIEGLLAYSRVQTHGRHFEAVKADEALDWALANLAAAIAESGGAIEVGPLPTVVGDATQLGQLFQNLIGNALKFRGDDPPRIRIGATERDGMWELTVRDNGIGIDDKYRDQVFEIFQGLHPLDEYEGSGIGLAVCKRIVKRHGGRIWCESTPGVGTTFHFTLLARDRRGNRDRRKGGDRRRPREAQPPKGDRRTNGRRPGRAPGPERGSRPEGAPPSSSPTRALEVLVAEDNPGDVRLLEEALREARRPVNLHVCSDGEQASDFLARRGAFSDAPVPDLILLDLEMPRKNGRQLLSEVKADPELGSIPVVVLTSSRAPEDIADSYARDANCCITKPVELDGFLHAMRGIEAFWFGLVELPERP